MVEEDAATMAALAMLSPSRAEQACSQADDMREELWRPEDMVMLTELLGLCMAWAFTKAEASFCFTCTHGQIIAWPASRGAALQTLQHWLLVRIRCQ